MLRERLSDAAAVDAETDSPAVRGRRAGHVNGAVVFRCACVRGGDNRPRAPIPMLGQLVSDVAIDIIGTDGPAIRRRCAGYIIEVVPLIRISVRRGNNRPRGPAPMLNQRLKVGTVIVVTDGPAIRRRCACDAYK